jgi:hypothetical protein
MSFSIVNHHDTLVVKNDGSLWYQRIDVTSDVAVYSDPNRLGSETTSKYSGKIIEEKKVSHSIGIDIPIDQYRKQVENKRLGELEEKRWEERWKKIVAAAEIVATIVPVFRVVKVSCWVLRAAASSAEVVEKANTLWQVISKPEEVLTEQLLLFLAEKGNKHVLMLDKLKLKNAQKLVLTSTIGSLYENSYIGKKAKPLVTTSLLGYSIDEKRTKKVRVDADLTLEHIHAFCYQYDKTYRAATDALRIYWEKSWDLRVDPVTGQSTN